MGGIVASHQPAFLPWPGFWHKFVAADTFIVTTGVEWAKDSYLNRCRYDHGWWTVPVHVAQHDPIKEAVVGADTDRLAALARAAETVLRSHRRYPYVWRLEWLVDMIRSYTPGTNLAHRNVMLIRLVGAILAPGTLVVVDSIVPTEPTKTDRLRERIRRHVPDADLYLMGAGASAYLDSSTLGVPVSVQDPSSFDPEVSILDVLGREPDPADWLRTQGRWR